MSDKFITKFMKLALEMTGAERGMAVDGDLNLLELANLTEQDIADPDFTGFQNIKMAYESDERPFVTNNLILEAEAAPNTNTNFTNLRLVVVFPMDTHGAVYVDRHVTSGVIPNPESEQLMRLAQHIIDEQRFDISQDDLYALYETV